MTDAPRPSRMAPKRSPRRVIVVSKRPRAPPPGNHHPIRHGLAPGEPIGHPEDKPK